MEAARLSLPSIDLRRPIESVDALLDVDAALAGSGGTDVAVSCGFVAPFGYAALEALRLRAGLAGKMLSLAVDPDPRYARPFSEVIGFGCEGSGSPTTVRLRHFRDGDDAAIGRFLLDEWAGRAERLSAVAVGYVVGSVGEVFANALTHARSPVGVIACGQYFKQSGDLHLSVVDLGIGIPASLAAAQARREEEIDPAAAIEWAFESGHSTLPTSRGLGLANLRAFILRIDATLHVFSGFAYARLAHDGWHASRLLRRFPGTLVDLQLPTAQVRTPSSEERYTI